MKNFAFITFLIVSAITGYSQNKNNPVEVTPTVEEKISQEIGKESELLKSKLKKEGDTEAVIEFTIDTFRIELYLSKYISYDWSTAGMRYATYEVASRYDSLLNKYYKKLQTILKPEDKKVLANAQKSWITFRNNELKLINVVGKDEYSGGGTIQQLMDASEYLEIIQQRVFKIYHHYLRATQDY
ncbi:MAG: DUF1311 domain-containing protein [Chitinophagaceae bacterium]|nr:DUF1311 domain-containing protein [Chitinophagaceae bacterium]